MNAPLRLSLVACAALAACRSPQAIPGPMFYEDAATEAARGGVPGTLEAQVVRHSDPVYVRRPGSDSGFPLAFYRKKERMRSGGSILVGEGGRAELLWTGDETSVVLFDHAVVFLGEPSRDEPIVTLRSLTQARLVLMPKDRMVLMGGAVLRGDSEETTGPFVVDRIRTEFLRLTNQSKLGARVEFREENIDLGPGDSIDLPILAEGTAPLPVDPFRTRVGAGGMELVVTGEVGAEPMPGAGVRVRAGEPTVVSGLGVRVTLDPGEEAVFGPLEERPPLGEPPPPADEVGGADDAP